MNPFDGPPSSPPVSFDRPPGPPTEPVASPAPSPGPEPRRGRMVVGVFAAAVLLGAAAFGVSELASADDDPEPADDPDAAGTDESSTDASADDDTDRTPSDDPGSSFHADGELRLDLGDGEPIIIDLDDIDPEALHEFTDCIGLPGLEFGEGLPGIDPEMFDEQFDQFFEEFDPELFDQFFGEMSPFGEDFGQFFEEFDPELFDQFFEEMSPFGEDFDQFFEEFDPEQFEEQFDQFFGDFEFDGEPLDPEQFEQELGPLLESGDLGELFDQFFEEFDPELFDQFFEDLDPELFDQFFEQMPPFGGEFGEHEAGHRAFERPTAPGGGSWLPSGLDREQIESCLAELD
jgi:hypothetical protein